MLKSHNSKLKMRYSLNKRKRSALFMSILASLCLSALITVALPTRTFAQQQPAPVLSSAQLRDLVVQATDKIERLEKESDAAIDYILALKKQTDADTDLIKLLEERDASRQEEVKSLREALTLMKAALATSEQATANATAEATRQQKRASRWKLLAKIGTVAGAVVGATAAVLMTR